MGGNEGNVLLVQFRMDNLLGGLVGDSEANFKRCRKRIEALAPCVVLMDEIEKTFAIDKASGKNDVKMNILTALLDWMQENKKQIFFFAEPSVRRFCITGANVPIPIQFYVTEEIRFAERMA